MPIITCFMHPWCRITHHEEVRWLEKESRLLSYLARNYLTVWARLMRHILDACPGWILF